MIIDGVVTHERWYPHPIEQVRDAITNPAALATWLMPNDAVSGRRVDFVFDGGEHYGAIAVELVEQVPLRLLRWTWTIGTTRTAVSIRLTVVKDGTALHLEHRALDNADAPEFDEGWASKLDHDLTEVLTGRRRIADVAVRNGLLRHPAFTRANPAEENTP